MFALFDLNIVCQLIIINALKENPYNASVTYILTTITILMTQEQKNNPLHGVKLEALLNTLVDEYGWETLAQEMNFNCFKSNPSIKSSLKFLRKTEWAREKIERFFLYDYKKLPRPSRDEFDTPPRKRTASQEQVNTKPRHSQAKLNPWENSSKAND